MNLSLRQIDASIEELETLLPQLEKASSKKHTHADAGWWLTMAGSSGGTALAVSAGNQAHELDLSLIHISEPTRQEAISYAVFCLKKKKHTP